MTTDELKAYCLTEIKRLQQEKALYESAVNLRLGGIASYEDIIRQIDGVPDPGSQITSGLTPRSLDPRAEQLSSDRPPEDEQNANTGS